MNVVNQRSALSKQTNDLNDHRLSNNSTNQIDTSMSSKSKVMKTLNDFDLYDSKHFPCKLNIFF